MKFENTAVNGFESAFRGMRNPKNSWANSDSYFNLVNLNTFSQDAQVANTWVSATKPQYNWPQEYSDKGQNLATLYAAKLCKEGILKRNPIDNVAEVALLGPKDMQLAQRLIAAGPEHRKFLRQIFVSVDITAPLYWY